MNSENLSDDQLYFSIPCFIIKLKVKTLQFIAAT
jgi:hypothetical protein